MSDAILTSENDGVLEITINRPDQRNCVNSAVAQGIAAAIDRLDSEVDLRCAILTGAGGTFCAGMDLKAWLRGEPDAMARHHCDAVSWGCGGHR